MFSLPADWRGQLSVYGSRLASVFLAAALSVAGARMLAPEGWGSYATIGGGVELGAQVTNLGLSSALLVFFSRHPEKTRLVLPRLWFFAAAWAILLTLLFQGLRLLRTDFAGIRDWLPVVAVWVPLKLLRLHQVNLLTALKSFGWISKLEIGGRLAMLVLGLGALVSFPNDILVFVCALVLADLLVVLTGTAILQKVSPRLGEDASQTEIQFPVLRIALRAYPLLLLPWILVRADLLLVRALRGPEEAGLYAVAAQLTDVAFLLPTTVAAFLVPALAREGETPRGLLRVCRSLGVFLLIGCLLIAVFGRPAIRLAFGAPYLGSYPALLLLLPGFVALSLGTMFMHYFSIQDYPSILVLYWSVAVAVNLTLNVVLIPRFGYLAAAATSSVGYVLVSTLVLRYFLRHAGLEWRSVVSDGRGSVIS